MATSVGNLFSSMSVERLWEQARDDDFSKIATQYSYPHPKWSISDVRRQPKGTDALEDKKFGMPLIKA